MDFEHGGCIRGIDGVIDFSSNVNPLPFPENIKRLFKRSIETLRKYPDPFCSDLTDVVSSRLGIDREEILFDNGSVALIYLILCAIKPESVLIFEPTFSEYERASKAHKAKIKKIRLDERFMVPISKIESADMMFLCHPNNPTGNFLIEQRESILDLPCKYFLIDEAFIDFVEHEERFSFLPLFKKEKRLIILRTFTKFFPLAGIRIGYLVADREIIRMLKDFKPPWSVNGIAIILAKTFIEEETFAEKTKALIRKEKVYLMKGLSELGFISYPSATNFILVKLKEGYSSKEVKGELVKKGILIRDCSNFSGLDERFIRICVRTRKDNKKLIGALRELCSKS